MKARNKIILLAALCGLSVYAATKGDTPAATGGATQVKGYDGGSASATAIPMMNGQNVIAVFNNGIQDGGTSRTIYCGWTPAVSPTTGLPVSNGTMLTVDIVSVCTGPQPYDGGTITCNPQLYCVAASTATFDQMDVRQMRVK